jgi:hypothetical protein
MHSDVSKKCVALWRRIDFQILGVKIRVWEFDKTTFLGEHICSTKALFSSMARRSCFVALHGLARKTFG